MTPVYISSHPSTHPPSYYDLLCPVFLLHSAFSATLRLPSWDRKQNQPSCKLDAQESSSQASSERSPSPFAASKATCKVWSWETASVSLIHRSKYWRCVTSSQQAAVSAQNLLKRYTVPQPWLKTKAASTNIFLYFFSLERVDVQMWLFKIYTVSE